MRFHIKDRSIELKGRTWNLGGELEREEPGWFFYVHPGINKGGIQRKHMFFLKISRKGNNEPTISFPMKRCAVWLSHFPYCGTQSKKTVIQQQDVGKWFSTKDFNRRLKESSSRNYPLLNKSKHSIYYFAEINECETGKHDCDSNAFCNNTEGSYICTCKPGYTGNGVNCTGKIRKWKPSADSTAITWYNSISIQQIFFEFY